MTITNCFFNGGEINVIKSGVIQLGGFLGESSGGSFNINNCGAFSGTITADAGSRNYVGGFISLFFPGWTIHHNNVSNCFSMIDIITTGSCQHNVGGFISYINSFIHNINPDDPDNPVFIRDDDNISNCYATGTINSIIDGDNEGEDRYYEGTYMGYSSCIGGFAGLSLGIMENCYALGNVMVNYSAEKNTVYAGGLVGSISNEGSVSKCFSAGRVSAGSVKNCVYSGGIVGYNGGTINNTAALGASVTVKGPPGSVIISWDVGRIWGNDEYSECNNNYALNTMTIEKDKYNSINPDTRTANDGKDDSLTPFDTTRDGKDANSGTFYTQVFWRTTLGFSPNVWDFSRVAINGYPRLANVGGQ